MKPIGDFLVFFGKAGTISQVFPDFVFGRKPGRAIAFGAGQGAQLERDCMVFLDLVLLVVVRLFHYKYQCQLRFFGQGNGFIYFCFRLESTAGTKQQAACQQCVFPVYCFHLVNQFRSWRKHRAKFAGLRTAKPNQSDDCRHRAESLKCGVESLVSAYASNQVIACCILVKWRRLLMPMLQALT